MSRTTRLELSIEPEDTAQAFIIFNGLVQFIEAGTLEMVKDSLGSGHSLTIPAGYQHIVYDSFDIIGDLTNEGTLVIL